MFEGEVQELHNIRSLAPQSSQNATHTLRKHSKGFTLVELVVTLSVFAIIVTIAIPSFNTLLQNARLSANTDSIVNALNYARNTALAQSVNVRVCPLGTANSTTCGTSWNNGWIVITQPTSGAATLLKSQAFTTSRIAATVTSIVFDNHGLATTQNNFTVCDTRGASYARSIQVLATGFVQAGPTAGVAVWNNGSLTCP